MYTENMFFPPQYGVTPFNYSVGDYKMAEAGDSVTDSNLYNIGSFLSDGIMKFATKGALSTSDIADKFDKEDSVSDVRSNAYKGALIDFGLDLTKMGLQSGIQDMMQNKANMYNSPAAMMRRMLEAGINPNAAAQGIAGAPGAGASTTASVPSGGLSRSGLLESLANSTNTALGSGLLESEMNVNNATADYTKSQNFEQNVRNKYADWMQNENLKSLVNQNRISENMAYMYSIDAKYHDAQAYGNLVQTYQNIEILGQQLLNLQEEFNLIMAQEYATMMAGNLSSAQINKVFSDIGLNNAQIGLIAKEAKKVDAETLLTGAQIRETDSRTAINKTVSDYQAKLNDIFEKTGFDMRSPIDANVISDIKSGNLDGAEQTLESLQVILSNEGKGRSYGRDFKIHEAFSLINSASNILKIL